MLKNIFNPELKLAKTHDFCASGEPEITAVFLHGIASDSSAFNKALEYLEGTTSLKNVRFVTFDLLGAGKSYKSDKLNYDFNDQLTALDNSLISLNLNQPVILIGHSMGTLIAERYADLHKKKVKALILISPPIYRPEDFSNPIFLAGVDNFEKVVLQRNKELKDDKAFHAELQKIVMNKNNYAVLKRINKPMYIIYGLADQIIASFNIPRLMRENKNVTAIQTPGTHGVSHDKYSKIVGILEEYI